MPLTTHNAIQRDLTTTYPVVDRIPYDLAKRIGLSDHECARGLGSYKTVAAVWTGEKRQPRRGEWFLSGAEVSAYLASHDLSTPYHIARLVRVRTEIVEIVEEIAEPIVN